MRRALVLTAVFLAALLTAGPAQAFHRHRYYPAYTAGMAAPMVGYPAPLSAGQIIQLVGTGLHLITDIRQGVTDQRQQQQPQRVMVDAEVVRTIESVETKLNAAVTKSNSILDLNKSLYTGVTRVGTTTSGTGGSSGDARRPGGGGTTGPSGQN